MNKFFILVFVAFFVSACQENKDIINPKVEIDKTAMLFSNKAGKDSFNIKSNADWVIEKNADADWLSVSKVSGTGDATITVSVGENSKPEPLQTKLTVKVNGGQNVEIAITQSKGDEFAGLYILSESSFGTGKSDLAFYDVKRDTLYTKYFSAQNNGKTLGDVGNDLALYGHKLYCVVSGSGTNYEGHIEIINPNDGKSLKSITVVSPRCITFHENKAYVTTWSRNIIRIDTASLTIDGTADLTGTFAEGVCKHDGKLYVCNSGQGNGRSISVVDIASFQQTDSIIVPANPLMIYAVPSGELYFTTGDITWSNGPKSNLHALNPSTKQITKTFDVRASKIAVSRDYVYAVDFDWEDYSDHFSKINHTDKSVTDLSDKLEDELTMVYNVSVNPLNNDVYITNQGDKVVIMDKNDELKPTAFRVGVPYVSKVVSVFK
ncbi:MAG: hypothetical protein LBG92_05245 [Prevotellaceae bacterium]|jgi:hypothetical protein|nr:hypothetical protein [Prevotellaceae bacterium]